MGYHAALALANTSYTIAWWQDWNGPSYWATQRVISAAGSGGYSEFLTESGGTGTFTSTQNGDTVPMGYTATASTGWTHMAVVFNGSTRTLYVNDVSQGAMDATPISAIGDHTDSLSFGGVLGLYAHNQDFNGILDDIQIYNQALTGVQIGIVYGGGIVTPEPCSLVLLITGAIGLVCYAWRKRSR